MDAPDDDPYDDPELLWLSARYAPEAGDRAAALLRYALLRPDDVGWREQLREELRTQTTWNFLGAYLNCLTLFPDHGAFAAPEVLALTRHPNRFVRRWASEVLRMLVVDHRAFVTPEPWAEVVRERLADEDPIVREEAGVILAAIEPRGIRRRRGT
jgi:hypothetical protein